MEDIRKFVELGSAAVVALALLWTLYYVLTRFTNALDNLSRRLDGLGTQVETAVDINSAILLGLQSQLLTHDLTVSGLNPAAGSTVTERDSRAFAKYVEIQRNLQMVRDDLIRRRGGHAINGSAG
jgi:hypothetical protein